jgi:hypothetical protein
VLDRLGALGAEVVLADEARQALPATMWRFLALADREAEAVICRDADSLLNARDVAWVGAWLESGLPFHIIRDYFTHSELILAGLFGARGGVLGDIETSMRQWLTRSGAAGRWTDQHFLRACVWPLARDAALTHDPWFGYGSCVVPATAIVADQHDHVGANHSSTTMTLALDCPDGSLVQWALVDAAGARVTCLYSGEVRDRRHVIDIPRLYAQRIHDGEWKVWWAITPPAKERR